MNLSGGFFVRLLYPSALLYIILLSAGCQSHETSQTGSSSPQLRQLVNEVDQVYAPNATGIQTIDSIYRSLRKPTAEDMCDQYLLKSYHTHLNALSEELYADSVILIIRQKGLENSLGLLYGKAYLCKGEALMNQKKYNDAYRCYYEGIKLIQQTHDTFQFDKFNDDLGMICYRQGDYIHAAKYFKECVSEEAGYGKVHGSFYNFERIQANLDNAGLCYDKLGMTDTAINYYDKALDYITSLENNFKKRKDAAGTIEMAKGVIYGNLATAEVNKGDFKDAETLFRKSIQINIQKKYDSTDAWLTQLKLAGLYMQTSRLKEAAGVLDTLKMECNNGRADPYGNVEIKWYKLESDYCNLSGQPQKAFVYLNTYITHKDSAEAVNKKLASIDFNKVFEDIKQENSYATLKKEDEMKNINGIVAIIFLFMMIAVTIFISRNNWKLKKLNERIVTQNKEMQQALNALEQSQHENTRMLEMVSHDLRDPLQAIRSMINLLLEKKGTAESQAEALKLIQTSCSALLGMSADMLSASINPEGMKIEEVDIKTLLQYCVNLLQYKANDKKQEIKLSAEDITMRIDREKIWRVMSNLITNAIKFGPESSIIEVGITRKHACIQVSVKDYGISIPDSLKNTLFDVYQNNKNITSGNREYGLGLSISKQIVEALGGTIWLESNEWGTTFYVEFPESMEIKQIA